MDLKITTWTSDGSLEGRHLGKDKKNLDGRNLCGLEKILGFEVFDEEIFGNWEVERELYLWTDERKEGGRESDGTFSGGKMRL